MATPLRLTALPGFKDDILGLSDLRARKLALDMLVLVRGGQVAGVKLDERVDTGDLGGCFKVYFDPVGSRKPQYRLVYRYLHDETHAEVLEAVAVGLRANFDAYRRAIRNLGRGPQPADEASDDQ